MSRASCACVTACGRVRDGLERLAEADPADGEGGQVAHQPVDPVAAVQRDQADLAVGLRAPRRAHAQRGERALGRRRCPLVLDGPRVGGDDHEAADLGQPQGRGDVREALPRGAHPAEQRGEGGLADARAAQQLLGLHVAVGGRELLGVHVHRVPQRRGRVEQGAAARGVLAAQLDQPLPDVQRGEAVGVQDQRQRHPRLGPLAAGAARGGQQGGLVDHHALDRARPRWAAPRRASCSNVMKSTYAGSSSRMMPRRDAGHLVGLVQQQPAGAHHPGVGRCEPGHPSSSLCAGEQTIGPRCECRHYGGRGPVPQR